MKLEEFINTVKLSVLTNPTYGLERLKVVQNHWNTARLEVEGQKYNVCLAFYVLGSCEEKQFYGQVVLPWCRPLSASGNDTDRKKETQKTNFITVDILRHCSRQPTRHTLGEGHARLYDSISKWWKGLELQVPGGMRKVTAPSLPWPHKAKSSLALVKNPTSRLWREPHIFLRSGITHSSGVPNKILEEGTILHLIPVSVSEHGVDTQGRHIERPHRPDVLFGLLLQQVLAENNTVPNEHAYTDICKKIEDAVTQTVHYAMLTPLECEVEIHSHGVELNLSAALERLWKDLYRYAAMEGQHLHAQDILFIMRHAKAETGLGNIPKRVRFEFFDLQLKAVKRHVEKLNEDDGGILMHLLRKAMQIAEKRFGAERVTVLRALQEYTDTMGISRDIVKEIFDTALEKSSSDLSKITKLYGIDGRAHVEHIWELIRNNLRLPFPLYSALSNSTMDTNAVEDVMNWPEDGRVLPDSLSLGNREDKEAYPAPLLITELVSFSKNILSDLLYIPIVAPVYHTYSNDSELPTVSEPPAFGVVMVSSSLIEPSLARIIVKAHSGIIHEAIVLDTLRNVLKETELKKWEGETRQVSPDTAPPSVEKITEGIKDFIVSLYSLSGRLTDVTKKEHDLSFRGENDDIPIMPATDTMPGEALHLKKDIRAAALHEDLSKIVSLISYSSFIRHELISLTKRLAVIGHDINNFLNPIIGWVSYIEMLAEDILSGQADNKEAGNQIIERTQRIKAKADKGLKWYKRIISRLSTHQSKKEMADIGCGRIKEVILDSLKNVFAITEMQEDLQAGRYQHISKEGINCVFENKVADPSRLKCKIDEDWLMISLENLFYNAVEAFNSYKKGNKLISIQMQLDNADTPRLEIMISDSGEGIDRSIIEKINRGIPVSTKEGHSGLGLCDIRLFAMGHGGEFTIDRGEPGGTISKLILPVTTV